MVTEPHIYITTSEQLEKATETLSRAPIVAVDLEADSMFHFTEKVCLIQMATDKSAFIIDPLALPELPGLVSVFADPAIVKVFHGADYDVRSLYRDFGFSVENLFDTELACRFLGYSHSSLEAVLKKHFDVDLDKKYQKKDWSIRPLPEAMIAYAANDVRYLVDLYRELTAALEAKARLDWAVETCKDISRVRAEDDADADRPLFMRIKGAGRLDARSLAVLEKLALFRQQTARKKDRPPYKIISNNALLALAQKKPKTVGHLHGSGILTKKQCNMYGKAIIDGISGALQLPAAELPSYPKTTKQPSSPVVNRRVNALKKWRDRKAAQLEMDPAMLINNAAIKKIAKQEPKTLIALKSVAVLKDWQVETFGEQWVETILKTG